MPRRPWIGRTAAASAALAAATVLALAGPAGASTRSAAGLGATPRGGSSLQALRLRPMPHGAVSFGRRRGRLTVHAALFGLTPGSSHGVGLLLRGHRRMISFSTLTASSAGRADATLASGYTGRLLPGSRLVIRMGTARYGVASEPIAVTGRLSGPGYRPHRLIAVEAGRGARRRGPLRGRATVSYNASRHTLTVTVSASGLTPGPHAAHIHLGSCMSQGPVEYMLGDLAANRRGQVIHAVRVFAGVTSPIPAHGWYLNIHPGSSKTILSNGQPTIFFRPLLCADIH